MTKKNRYVITKNKRVLPTVEEQRDALEESMAALLRRVQTTFQLYPFAATMCEDIRTVLERRQELLAGRPKLVHLKDVCQHGIPENKCVSCINKEIAA